MGWLSVLVGIEAVAQLYETGQGILFTVAILAVAGCLWSWGIMHNYATDMAKKHSSYREEVVVLY